MVKVGVIVVSFNTKELTDRCLASLLKSQSKTAYQVVVVDNDSNDGSLAMVKKKYPQIKAVASGSNLGFSKGNNLGVENLEAEYYLFLNSDTEVQDGLIDELVRYAQKEKREIISCQLVNPDGSFQPSGGDLPTIVPFFNWISGADDLLRVFQIHPPSFHQFQLDYYQQDQVGWVGGTVFFISSQLLKKLGGWDKEIFMYAEDVDLCWRAKQLGYKVGWTDQVQVMHVGGASSKNPKLRQWVGEFSGLIYLYKKYYGWLGAILLKAVIYVFSLLRIIGFTLQGRLDYAKTYGKVIFKI